MELPHVLALLVKVDMFEEGHIFSATLLFFDIATDGSVKKMQEICDLKYVYLL